MDPEGVDWLQPSCSNVAEYHTLEPVRIAAEIPNLTSDADNSLEGEPTGFLQRPSFVRDKGRLRMPKEGIVTKDGHLFHHVVPRRLNQRNKDRLMEHGIKLKHREFFTLEEDKRIKRNWSKFADKNGFKYEDGRYYAGYVDSSDLRAMVDRERESAKLAEMGLWPSLCRKLERRAAVEVQFRMIFLFDPHYVGLPDPITMDEALRGYKIISRGGTLSEAAMMLKRPIFTLYHSIYHRTRQFARMGYSMEDATEVPQIREKREMSPLKYRSLFHAVIQILRIEEHDVREQMFTSRSFGFMENLTIGFNWEFLVPKFHILNVGNLKEAWAKLMSDLLNTFLSVIDADPHIEQEAAWETAVEEALPVIDVSMNVLLPYLKALRKSTSEKAMGFSANYVDQHKMARQLCKYGIIGEAFLYELNHCPLYRRLQTIQRQKDVFIMRHLELYVSAKEKMKVLEMCYKFIMKSPNFNPTRKLVGLPRIDRLCYVENFVRYASGKFPEWQPPLVLQRWVQDPELFHLFSKKSDNSGVFNVQNILKMRKQFFGDSECLSGRELSGAEVALVKYLRPGLRRIDESTQSDAHNDEPEVETRVSKKKRKRQHTSADEPVEETVRVRSGWGEAPPLDTQEAIPSPVLETPIGAPKRKKSREARILSFEETSFAQEADDDIPSSERQQIATNDENEGITFDESRFANETVLAGCQSIMKKGNKKPRRSVRWLEDTLPQNPFAQPEPEQELADLSDEPALYDQKEDPLKHLRVEKFCKDDASSSQGLPDAFSQDDFMNLFAEF